MMVRKKKPSERAGKALSYTLMALAGAVSLAIGLFSLAHPFAAWLPGESRRSDLPPVFGVSLLVIPAFLVGLAIFRTWLTLELDFEAWQVRRLRRQRKSQHPPA